MQTRKQKTLINENIEWLLNLTDAFIKNDLQQSNMKPLPKALMQNDFLLSTNVYTYNQEHNKFMQHKMELYPNMIIKEQQFLILSTCQIEKTRINYKEFNAQGLILSNQLGQTYLFFANLQDLQNWTKLAKKFCKLANFLSKFTIKEKTNVPNVFACVKNKTNAMYTVHIFRLLEFDKNPCLYEQLMNEINILMSLKHPCLLRYCSLYEDYQHLYVLYEYWVGDPLYKVIEQGLILNSVQISKIIFQLVKFIKFIHKQNLYHAQITPSNIILLRNNVPMDTLQIVVTNFAYREDIGVGQLIRKLPKQWVPPEMYIGNVQQPQKIDQYQIGCTLFYLCTYKPQLNSYQLFNKTVENIDISYLRLISEQQLGEKSQLTWSQIDLLLQLMQQDPNKRKDLKDICHHHWFVKIKEIKQAKQKLLPSLRTILEIREMSSMEVKMETKNARQSSIESDDSSFDDLNSFEDNQLTDFIMHLNSQNLSVHKT